MASRNQQEEQVEADVESVAKDGLQGTPTLITSGRKRSQILVASGDLSSYVDFVQRMKVVS